MNKQFEKLIAEAFFDEATNEPEQKMYTLGEDKVERFAQLIVQECASKIGENFAGAIGSHASAHNTAVKQCQQTILEHFGVELDDQSS